MPINSAFARSKVVKVETDHSGPETGRRWVGVNATFLGPLGYSATRITRVEERMMDDNAIGWIAAIIIGGIAGWLAEMFMKSNQGVLMNIVLGIVGAVIANFLLGLLGIALGGWIGYLIAGFIGACILIAIGRAVTGRARV